MPNETKLCHQLWFSKTVHPLGKETQMVYLISRERREKKAKEEESSAAGPKESMLNETDDFQPSATPWHGWKKSWSSSVLWYFMSQCGKYRGFSHSSENLAVMACKRWKWLFSQNPPQTPRNVTAPKKHSLLLEEWHDWKTNTSH